MEQRKPVEGFIEKLMDVLAIILAEPRTARTIIEITDYKADTVHKYLDKGIDFGLVYIIDYADPTGPGRRSQPIYAAQSKPFEKPNAQPPAASNGRTG